MPIQIGEPPMTVKSFPDKFMLADKSGVPSVTPIEWKGGDAQRAKSTYIPISEHHQPSLRRRTFQ